MTSARPGTWRLLAPALVTWGCVAWAITTPGSAGLIGMVAGIAGAALVLVAWGRRGRSRSAQVLVQMTALACALLVLLGARVTEIERSRGDPALVAAAQTMRAVAVDVTLTGFPKTANTSYGARSSVRATAARPQGGVPVLIFLEGEARESWAPGTRLTVTGRPTASPPGDSAAFAMTVDRVEGRSPPTRADPLGWITQHTGEVAAWLRHSLRGVAATVPGAALVPGFAVGDTSLVSAELDAAMLESSLTHLTAVSGANCALVTGAVIWIASRCGAGRRIRIALAAVGLAGFVVLVGPDASVQRAAVMAVVILVSNFGGKRSAALPALGAAIVVLLLQNPWQALQPGFALSVAATGGILLLAAPLTIWLQRRAHAPRWLALPIGVALAAQLACGPLLLLLQPGIPAVGILANVLAAPAAPLGTGLGLLAALLLPVWGPLGTLFVTLASLPSRWVAATAEVSAALPGARWHWPESWLGAALLALCQMAIVLAILIHRGAIRVPFTPPRPRRQPWAAALPLPHHARAVVAFLTWGSLGAVVAVTLAWPAATRLTTPDGWVVVACDVGQGDALLLRHPQRPSEVMLVDTGDDAELLLACLDRFEVDRIALLMLSHDDRDHVGALDAVLDRTERAIVAPMTVEQESEGREVTQTLLAAGVPFSIGEGGMSGRVGPAVVSEADSPGSGLGSGIVWQILAPSADSVPYDTNATSLVAKVAIGAATVLLLGDSGLEGQQELLNRVGLDVTADVIKVAHHGSRDQDPGLPAATGAQWALVSVGGGNGYGHPAVETIAAHQRAGTTVLRTDLHGSIALVPTVTGELRPWVERAE